MTEAASNEEMRELQVLMVPWHGDYLMLPNAAVVEVLRSQEIKAKEGESANWLLGDVAWRNISLPLISMEQMLNLDEYQTDQKKRILVCHLLSDELEQPFVGIEVYGIPQLRTLDESMFKVIEPDSDEKNQSLVATVTVGDDKAYIPDLEKIGQMLA